MQGDLEQIEKVIRANRNYQLFVSTMLLLVGVSMFFLPKETTESMAVSIPGALLCLIGAYFLVKTTVYHRHAQKRIIEGIQSGQKDIVWVYSYVVVNMPYGVRVLKMAMIYFYFLDGSQLAIKVPEKKLDGIMICLNRLLPHATFGHSKEKEQLYKANPALLLRFKEGK